MKIHPYIVVGIGARPWTTYRVHDECAIIEGWFRGPFTIPLKNATIECEKSIKYQLGFGSIEIISEGGVKQAWENVPKIKSVSEQLLRVSKGFAPAGSKARESSPWDRLRVLGEEKFHAYGHDYNLCVFTGRLKQKEAGDPRGASVFVDDEGREERISVITEKINGNELHSNLKVGDQLSMALFVRNDGLPCAYFMLFDHARQKEYLFPKEAVYDLSWSKAPQYGNAWTQLGMATVVLVAGALLVVGWQAWKAIVLGLVAGGLAKAIPLEILERRLQGFAGSAQLERVRQFVKRR